MTAPVWNADFNGYIFSPARIVGPKMSLFGRTLTNTDEVASPDQKWLLRLRPPPRAGSVFLGEPRAGSAFLGENTVYLE